MTHLTDTHHFAFYTEIVTSIVHKAAHLDIHEITDSDLVHRIVTVLRFQKGDSFILFNTTHHISGHILGINSKKAFMFEVVAIKVNTALKPAITWGLPLLKREAFEEALYSLCELGVTRIQPLVTKKTSRSWAGEKEQIRSQKILIAAAEQSKQFVIPQLMPVLSLEQWLVSLHHRKNGLLFFDAAGDPIAPVIRSFTEHKPEDMFVLTGPEGDLTLQEKELLANADFTFCKLTPTIVRAQQAVALGLGILRSMLI